ncbi:unnamed protein product [Rotaria magnacalcarata]|uniref:Uncharacterized protein n=1 Tax=Rotaria magnacalcarata TaxID=392030 RepID=A0A8S3BMY2_9BILA|nr:unnamed protein product [Rotaria magnacalcarata]
MSKCSQDQYRKETTTNNEFSVKQENNDQQQLPSIQEGQHGTVEVVSPAQIHGEESTDIDNKKPKCHGNKKLQRFKRKWRTRGLNEEEIVTLINTRSHDNLNNH